MAFCNSCGAALDAGTKFCNKCGAAASAAPAAPGVTPVVVAATTAPVQPTTGGGGALKIILIVIAIIVGLGILTVGAFSFFVYRVAKSAHVSQNGDSVKVDTPFGSLNTGTDAAQVVKDLGVDIYPGAVAQKNGTATMSFGNVKTVTAAFQSTDSLDKVCDFYKSKYPSTNMTTSDTSHCAIVAGDQKNMITINVQAYGDGTKIQIANVNKKLTN